MIYVAPRLLVTVYETTINHSGLNLLGPIIHLIFIGARTTSLLDGGYREAVSVYDDGKWGADAFYLKLFPFHG